MLADQLANVGKNVTTTLYGFGRFSRFFGHTCKWMLRGPRGFNRFRLLMPQLYAIGTTSIAVVVLVGGFVGAVLGIETYDQFAAFGQETRLGGVIDISVVKQIGPVLAAVMIAGRVGGAVSAELGTMRVTEQIDALQVMGADPIAYLVVPRVTACLLMVPILTIFSNLAGVIGGWLVVVKFLGVDEVAYWEFAADFVTNYDVFTGLAKALVFGLAIGMISCYKGFHCESGARGVGRAATDAFVTSFLAIIVANFFLAKLLKDLYDVIYGAQGVTAFG
jgi:phospholipid/cholesterol/gamma-HCH transport system permease protein